MTSTIERLAELAKGATQGPDVEFQFYDHGGARLAKFAGERVLIADFYNEADSQYYFHCNPAAIDQAHAEYKAVSECADNAEREVVKLLAERAELERRNAELVEAARLAESALSFTYGGEPVDPTGAITALRAARAHSAQEK